MALSAVVLVAGYFYCPDDGSDPEAPPTAILQDTHSVEGSFPEVRIQDLG